MKNMYCKIFINTQLTRAELAYKISEFLGLEIDAFFSIDAGDYFIDIKLNKEFDEDKLIYSDSTDSFLYFPYFLDIDLLVQNTESQYKAMIKQLLEYLLESNLQAIVACDFEDEL